MFLWPLMPESMRPGRRIGQRAELDIPGRGKVVAANAFRVFTTRSLKVSRQQSSVPAPSFLDAHKFWEVIVESPKEDIFNEAQNVFFGAV